MRCATESRRAMPRAWKLAARIFSIKKLFTSGWALALSFSAWAGEADVVINEIMYHPPTGRTNLQWVELFNRGPAEVDLSKWSFTKGIQFTIPDGTRLGAGSYLVICRDTA